MAFYLRSILALMSLLVVILFSGCSSVGFYSQGIVGHLQLMAQREDIDDLLASSSLDEKTRLRLVEAKSIRSYASETLGLPDNRSYLSYVELDRPYVVWSVVATEKYSLKPLESCFSLIGCVTYRGYYQRKAAEAYADKWRVKGYDVFVGGVQAYSTLGWFDDPVLSSMFGRGEILFAEVVFHELAHQALYVDDDTAFNEAFATVVGEQGVRQWLADTGPKALPRYEAWLKRKSVFVALLQETSDQLRRLYLSGLAPEEMQVGKENAIEVLRDRFAGLKREREGFDDFDPWFRQPINNARLASVAVYRDLVPEFHRWLIACEKSIPDFLGVMETFKEGGVEERRQKLEGQASC